MVCVGGLESVALLIVPSLSGWTVLCQGIILARITCVRPSVRPSLRLSATAAFEKTD